MPMTAADAKEILTLLSAAKTSPLNFGICIPKKDADTVVILSKSKEADALAKLAKTAASGSKTCHGTCTVEGSVLMLDCAVKPPTDMAKICTAVFKALKITTTVKIAKEAKLFASIDSHPDAGKWEKAAAKLQPLLDGSLSRLKDGPTLRSIWDFALSAAEEGDIPKALAAHDKLAKALDGALKSHGENLKDAFAKAFAEVEKGLTEAEAKTLRDGLAIQTGQIGKATAQDVEDGFRALHATLNFFVKATKGAASSTLAAEKATLSAEEKKVQDQIDALEKDAKALELAHKKTQADAQKLLNDVKALKPGEKNKAPQIEKKIELLKETQKTQLVAATKKAKEIVPLVAKLKTDKQALSQATVDRFAELQAQIDKLTQSDPEKPFKEVHAALEAKIKEMADAGLWRDGKDGAGGELRRNQQDGSHGSSRHGAQTGIDRQARRVATAVPAGEKSRGVTPDSASRPGGVSAGSHPDTVTWKGANITWEVIDGKRKIKSRAEVQKAVVAEIANFAGLPQDPATSVFANPVLEKFAVDTAIKKISGPGWNEMYFNQDPEGWFNLLEVTITLGPPKDYGKKAPGWGYSLSRKATAAMALDSANAVLTKFEQGKITEAQMLDELGVEYLTLEDPDDTTNRYVPMVPYAKVVLVRASPTGAWSSKTHYPNPGSTAAGWDIENRRVRIAGKAETRARF